MPSTINSSGTLLQSTRTSPYKYDHPPSSFTGQLPSASIQAIRNTPTTVGPPLSAVMNGRSSSSTIMMNGTISNGSLFRNSVINSSKTRFAPNHTSSGLLSTSQPPPGPHQTSTGTTGNGHVNGSSFLSAKQPLLDLSRASHPATPITAVMGGGGGAAGGGGCNGLQTATPGQASSRSTGGGGGGFNLSARYQAVRSANSASDCDIISNSSPAPYHGIHEMLASLALMCLLSLLMAFLALFFLQKTGPILTIPDDLKTISDLADAIPPTSGLPASPASKSKDMPSSSSMHPPPPPRSHRSPNSVNTILSQSRIVVNSREYVRVFQISVSLSTLTISLNLCCLFVCCIQFLSAVKLLKTPQGARR